MEIFDGHLHTFRFKVSVRESIDLFKRQFQRFNVKKMSFLALPLDAIPGKVEFEDTDLTDNIKAMYFKSVFSPNAYAYAGLEYKGLDVKNTEKLADELLRQVKEYKAVGYDGIKMYEGHPNHRKLLGYPLFHEVFDKFFDYCEKENFPILMHLANPAEFWDRNKVSDYWIARGCYFDESYPKFVDFHEEILKRMDKNPNLSLSLAHWGFLTYDKRKAEKFMSYKNTMLDVCPGGVNFFNILEDKDFWIPFIEKYSNRITYGTDSYNFEYDNEESWLKNTGNRPIFVQDFFLTDTKHFQGDREFIGVGLKKKFASKIFYENLANLLNEPNYINYDYFIEKCEKLFEKEGRDSLAGYNLWCMKNDFKSMKNGRKL